MYLRIVILSVSVGWVFIAQPSAIGRIVENWSYERLFKKADLVVIATAVSTQETNDSFIDKRWPLEFVGQKTTFLMMQTLKGKHDGKQFEVLHYKFGKPYKKGASKGDKFTEIIDAPSFVSFRMQPAHVEIAGVELSDHKFEYLLFLKRRDDGRYEPVSGQIDPDLSIRELFKPFFSRDTRTGE